MDQTEFNFPSPKLINTQDGKEGEIKYSNIVELDGVFRGYSLQTLMTWDNIARKNHLGILMYSGDEAVGHLEFYYDSLDPEKIAECSNSRLTAFMHDKLPDQTKNGLTKYKSAPAAIEVDSKHRGNMQGSFLWAYGLSTLKKVGINGVAIFGDITQTKDAPGFYAKVGAKEETYQGKKLPVSRLNKELNHLLSFGLNTK